MGLTLHITVPKENSDIQSNNYQGYLTASGQEPPKKYAVINSFEMEGEVIDLLEGIAKGTIDSINGGTLASIVATIGAGFFQLGIRHAQEAAEMEKDFGQ